MHWKKVLSGSDKISNYHMKAIIYVYLAYTIVIGDENTFILFLTSRFVYTIYEKKKKLTNPCVHTCDLACIETTSSYPGRGYAVAAHDCLRQGKVRLSKPRV